MDRHNLPNAFEVDAQIVMNQNVPEARNGTPVNLGMVRLKMLADPLSGFGKGLEIPENTVLNQFRLAKGRFTAVAISINTPNAIQDVLDIEPVVPHRGMAS
jgi:hypothetical protein